MKLKYFFIFIISAISVPILAMHPSVMGYNDIRKPHNVINYQNGTENCLECSISGFLWLRDQAGPPQKVADSSPIPETMSILSLYHHAILTDIKARTKLLSPLNIINNEDNESYLYPRLRFSMLDSENLPHYLNNITLKSLDNRTGFKEQGIIYLLYKDKESEIDGHYINFYIYKKSNKSKKYIYLIDFQSQPVQIQTVDAFFKKNLELYQENEIYIWYQGPSEEWQDTIENSTAFFSNQLRLSLKEEPSQSTPSLLLPELYVNANFLNLETPPEISTISDDLSSQGLCIDREPELFNSNLTEENLIKDEGSSEQNALLQELSFEAPYVDIDSELANNQVAQENLTNDEHINELNALLQNLSLEAPYVALESELASNQLAQENLTNNEHTNEANALLQEFSSQVSVPNNKKSAYAEKAQAFLEETFRQVRLHESELANKQLVQENFTSDEHTQEFSSQVSVPNKESRSEKAQAFLEETFRQVRVHDHEALNISAKKRRSSYENDEQSRPAAKRARRTLPTLQERIELLWHNGTILENQHERFAVLEILHDTPNIDSMLTYLEKRALKLSITMIDILINKATARGTFSELEQIYMATKHIGIECSILKIWFLLGANIFGVSTEHTAQAFHELRKFDPDTKNISYTHDLVFIRVDNDPRLKHRASAHSILCDCLTCSLVDLYKYGAPLKKNIEYVNTLDIIANASSVQDAMLYLTRNKIFFTPPMLMILQDIATPEELDQIQDAIEYLGI